MTAALITTWAACALTGCTVVTALALAGANRAADSRGAGR